MAKKSVLVVDDDMTLLRSIKLMLELDFDVLVCNSAMKAVSILEKQQPDVILLDYEMPITNGEMAFKMIKNLPNCKNVPIIFLTGVNSQENVHKILAIKPEDFILKPPVRDVLVSRINGVLK